MGGGESSKQETMTLAREGRGKKRDGRKRKFVSFILCRIDDGG